MGVCSGVGSSKVLTPFLHSATNFKVLTVVRRVKSCPLCSTDCWTKWLRDPDTSLENVSPQSRVIPTSGKLKLIAHISQKSSLIQMLAHVIHLADFVGNCKSHSISKHAAGLYQLWISSSNQRTGHRDGFDLNGRDKTSKTKGCQGLKAIWTSVTFLRSISQEFMPVVKSWSHGLGLCSG